VSTKPIAELGVAYFKGISVKEKGAEGEYVLVPSGAVFPEHIKLDRCKRFTDDPKKLSQKFLQSDDVLFNSGGVGTLGRSHHIAEIEPKTYVPDSFVLVLRTNGEQLLSKYLFYYLQSPAAQQLIQEHTRGTTGITSIKSEAVLGFSISCPPLAEQQRIVRLLDEAFEGIAVAKEYAERNLQTARALFESHLNSVLSQDGPGWVVRRIEEWCGSIMDCVNKTAPVVDYTTPYKMIRTTNVRNGRVDLSAVRYVSEETYQVWTRRQKPQPGDIILTREAPMGEVGMLLTKDKIFLGQRLVSYRVDSTIMNNHFLLFSLQSSGLQRQIQAKASGATVQHMRVPDTKNLLLAAPPLAKQLEIVAKLKSLQEVALRLVEIYELKNAALNDLKRSLLDQTFSEAFRAA